MEAIFLIRRVVCHGAGTGKEIWLFVDSGLAAYFMETTNGESATLSLLRHFLWNEWGAAFSRSGNLSHRARRGPRISEKGSRDRNLALGMVS
jgi:hypothetical protein